MPLSNLIELTNFAANDTNGGDNGTIGTPNLTWLNVAIAGGFILFNCAVSIYLDLQLEKSLIIAAIRCLVQLTIMGYILEDVFKANHPGIVMVMVAVLILLGAYETVYNKSKQTYHGMFVSVLISTAISALIIGVIGSRFAMEQSPFWVPQTFIPTMGMLLGNLLSGMAVALSSCLSSVSSNKEQIETYLAFGASRWEAGQSIAMEAVRLAMLPTINQMSVIGLISIPGMLSGQVLSGAPVMNAVRYQQIIMFMISASTALGVLGAVVFCIQVIIDGKDRLRPERIVPGRPSLLQDIKSLIMVIYHSAQRLFCGCFNNRKQKDTYDPLQQQDDDQDQDHDYDSGEENENQQQPLLR
ncbi:hypothetical protein BJ944DRAFT_161056 [Cunninghamella echinulata]|nr:hypothetical protein BJ944DRAFT_161056 [Cunninghamella echinulata]